MAEKSTAELSQDTWRFFNQRKRYLREPLGNVIDRFVEQSNVGDNRRSVEEIEARLDELDERHNKFSEKQRMSSEGLMHVFRMSELRWVLGR